MAGNIVNAMNDSRERSQLCICSQSTFINLSAGNIFVFVEVKTETKDHYSTGLGR